MTILTVIVLALAEGFASLMLVSGSGHLLIFEKLFGVTELPLNFLYFSVVLHMGNLLAVLIRYRREAWKLLRELLRALHILSTPTYEKKHPAVTRRELFLFVLALLPQPLILLLLKPVRGLYGDESTLLFVGVLLIVSGLVLFLSERFYRGSKDEKTATPLDALLIGLSQIPAVFPGLSRGALTCSVGVMRGLRREYAVRFSCLLSVPVILAALICELIAAGSSGATMPSVWLCLAGVAASTLASLLGLKLFERIAQYGRFDNLSYWCWGAGILSVILMLIS